MYDAPWFEKRDGEFYCLLCSAWATEGHVGSDRHKKREMYSESYGYAAGSAPPPPPNTNGVCWSGSTTTYTGATWMQDPAYSELMREYRSKPWFEERDGEWYCNLCNSWATEGHING